MSMLLTPEDIEAKAGAAGRTMADVCREAGIAPSTFNRWKRRENEPTLGVYRRLCAAVGVSVGGVAAKPQVAA